MRLVSAAVVFALSTGCALQQGAESILKPSMVSPEFKALDAPKKNPFAQRATRVDVLRVGIPTYDNFFRQAAAVKGTVVLADVVLKDTDKFISTTKRNVAAGRALSPAQQQQLALERQNVARLEKLLGDVPNKSQALTKSGESLTAGAAKTFIGPNAVKLPGVMKGLSQSTTDLKDAATKAPALLKHVQSTAGALTSLSP